MALADNLFPGSRGGCARDGSRDDIGCGLDLVADLADLLLVRDPARWSAGLARRVTSILLPLMMLCAARFASLREHARNHDAADILRRLIRLITELPARWASA